MADAERRSVGGESLVAGHALIAGITVEVAVFDFSFIAGSMGEVAGERLARAMERAAERRTPFVLVTSTGGARVQEGMLSLIQMPKAVAARQELADSGQPLIAVLEHPTTGGVLASAAALADVIAAVDGATIGFAGPRVVERFMGSRLHPSSHTARSAMTNGLVDALIARSERRSWLSSVLSVLAPDGPEPVRRPHILDRSESMRDAWDMVQAVRSEQRPRAPDLLGAIADGEIELRGDRNGADDRAIRAAIARIKGRRTIVIAFDRRLAPGPHGFRKAVRALQLAAQLGIPVVTLIDTSGADPSPESEAGGIAWAIAEALAAMLRLPVPVVCVVTGEGGSGGALALAAGDVLLAYESAVFSVIDPEAAAEILWRSGTRAAEAARLLKLGAGDLLRFGIADGVIPDPLTPENLKEAVAYHLELLARDGRSGAERGRDRRNKWRQSR